MPFYNAYSARVKGCPCCSPLVGTVLRNLVRRRKVRFISAFSDLSCRSTQGEDG